MIPPRVFIVGRTDGPKTFVTIIFIVLYFRFYRQKNDFFPCDVVSVTIQTIVHRTILV